MFGYGDYGEGIPGYGTALPRGFSSGRRQTQMDLDISVGPKGFSMTQQQPSALDRLSAWYDTPMGQLYKASMFVAVPLAAALSYQKNKSVGWAIVQGLLIPRFYLAYRGVQALTDDGGKRKRKNGKRRCRRNRGRRR
jgi:hypothetical protein